MLAELKKVRFPVETGLLLAFCVFLPLVEMPKNLAWLLYVGAWIANRARLRDWGGRWDFWDALIMFWIGSAYLAALFAGLEGRAWSKTGDLAMHTLLLWLVMRAGYSARELRWLLGALVASTLAGLAYGYWRMWSGVGKSGTLQLYSVGHVNHTAIYIAIILGICASWLFAYWRDWRPRHRTAALAVTAFVFASLAVTGSRGALGVGMLLMLVLALAWWPRWRAPIAASAIAVTVMATLLIGFNAEVVRKHVLGAAEKNEYSYRDGIWRMGFAAWEKYPWFGVGKDNYSRITHEHVRGWRAEAGKDYDASRYVRFPHAHSLFVNTLVERGIVGFGALAALLLAWLATLVRHRPPPESDDSTWLIWGGAASALVVTAGVGIVNTTLHHEHGHLAMLLLGLWLSTLRTRRAS